MGRDYYMQADYKRATEALEKAVAAGAGTTPNIALWLGRAWAARGDLRVPLRPLATLPRRVSFWNDPCS